MPQWQAIVLALCLCEPASLFMPPEQISHNVPFIETSDLIC